MAVSAYTKALMLSPSILMVGLAMSLKAGDDMSIMSDFWIKLASCSAIFTA